MSFFYLRSAKISMNSSDIGLYLADPCGSLGPPLHFCFCTQLGLCELKTLIIILLRCSNLLHIAIQTWFNAFSWAWGRVACFRRSQAWYGGLSTSYCCAANNCWKLFNSFSLNFDFDLVNMTFHSEITYWYGHTLSSGGVKLQEVM